MESYWELFAEHSTAVGVLLGGLITGIALIFLGLFNGGGALMFIIGAAMTIISSLIIYKMFSAVKENIIENVMQELEKQEGSAQQDEKIAHMEGFDKFEMLDYEAVHNYQKGIDAMRQLGNIIQNSAYQEKEKDWAILGGVADGIAGPGAGFATAVDTMIDNERIKAENAARRENAAKQNMYYQKLAFEAELNSPTVKSREWFEKNYDVVLSWKPSTLFSMIQLEKPNVTVDETTGAVCVDVLWSQNNTSICIDGSLRAKVYDNNGKCRGCAYLNLPKVGTYHRKGKLSGICMRPEGLKKLKSDKYTVVVEPMNLWELAAKGYGAPIENDKLTAEEHHKIVADSEAEFKKEVA